MKKLIPIIAVVLLLQSCYSYKTINTSCNQLTIGNTYKIQQNSVFTKMKLKAVTDTTLTLKHGKIEQQINRKDIVALQQKQLSAGKTIALVTPITTITLTALILTALFH